MLSTNKKKRELRQWRYFITKIKKQKRRISKAARSAYTPYPNKADPDTCIDINEIFSLYTSPVNAVA